MPFPDIALPDAVVQKGHAHDHGDPGQSYGTHKVTMVRTWLARHPRYHVYLTPTGGSWLNLVERLCAEVTERCVRRGSHTARSVFREGHARLLGPAQ